jgi:hypothetical protein
MGTTHVGHPHGQDPCGAPTGGGIAAGRVGPSHAEPHATSTWVGPASPAPTWGAHMGAPHVDPPHGQPLQAGAGGYGFPAFNPAPVRNNPPPPAGCAANGRNSLPRIPQGKGVGLRLGAPVQGQHDVAMMGLSPPADAPAAHDATPASPGKLSELGDWGAPADAFDAHHPMEASSGFLSELDWGATAFADVFPLTVRDPMMKSSPRLFSEGFPEGFPVGFLEGEETEGMGAPADVDVPPPNVLAPNAEFGGDLVCGDARPGCPCKHARVSTQCAQPSGDSPGLVVPDGGPGCP